MAHPACLGYATSIALALVAVSAVRQLGFLTNLPTVPAFDRLVGEHGMIWLPFTAVGAGLFALAQLVRVRRVVVQLDAVLVYRGARLVPRRYARSEYPAILRMKNSVHLSKGLGSALFNPTASPNLSEDEAGWVASELRKALGSRATAAIDGAA